MERPFAAWISKSGWFDPDERASFRTATQKAQLAYYEVDCGTLLAAADRTNLSGIAVIGSINQRCSSVPLAGQGPANTTAIDAQWLIRESWGNYVALGPLSSGRERSVLRSPFGSLACYWKEHSGHIIAASSLRLLSSFGAERPAVDWEQLGWFLASTDLRTGCTCLGGIQELTGGQALHVSQAGVETARYWSPWPFTERSQQHVDRATAASDLEVAVLLAAAGCVGVGEKAILLLSGGLDSSVVAAALKDAGRSFTCMTMVSADRLGDERAYARAAAHSAGARLIEVERRVGWIALDRPLDPGLPRPTGAQFRAATLGPAIGLSHREAFDVIVDGGGGDNMFCSLASVAPVIDHLLAAWPGRAALATATSLARIAKVGTGEVLRQVATRLASGRRRYRWHIDRSMLNRDLAARFEADHPWLAPPRGTLPGKAAQVGAMLAATAVTETFDGDRTPPIASPLVSQPVAEAALRIPTWMWLEEGRNRASVRRAFSARLPAIIVDRRSKGTPAAFMSALVEDRRDMLREQLLDGLLVKHGLVDRAAIDLALRPEPARDFSFARILQLADAEAWARSWS